MANTQPIGGQAKQLGGHEELLSHTRPRASPSDALIAIARLNLGGTPVGLNPRKSRRAGKFVTSEYRFAGSANVRLSV